jgi:hypothetical protein
MAVCVVSAVLTVVGMICWPTSVATEGTTDTVKITSFTVTPVSSNEIRLDMEATSTGGPVTEFIIYRNGEYLDTVLTSNAPPRQPALTLLKLP